MRRTRNAKIVATLGPSSSDKEMIRRLFDAGVDVFRLNFSHGSQSDHARRMEILRELERETGRPIGVLQDLQGPKIRVGALQDGGFNVAQGDKLRFVLEGGKGTPDSIPLPHRQVFEAIAPGHNLLVNDGRIRLKVSAIGDDWIETDVHVGGPMSDRKGVNLPDTLLDLSPLTEKDKEDLKFGLGLGVDFVALSFVQRAADVIEGRRLIGSDVGICSKIEKPKALEQLEDIIGAFRQHHGGARGPGRGNPARAGSRTPEGDDPPVPQGGQAGHHRDADAGIDGFGPGPDARGSLRRRNRDL